MKPETLQLLNDADDAVEWETPKGFDRKVALTRVKALQEKLVLVIDHPLELDDQVQDATYFAELFLLESASAPYQFRRLINIYSESGSSGVM